MMETLPITWRSSEAAYEDARVKRVFNLRRPSRYPLGIVNASKEDHVIEAVKLAIERRCRISVRSGGHSWAVSSVRDNAILVDLGSCRELSFNEETGRYEVYPATHSLASLKGIVKKPAKPVSIEDMNRAIAAQGASAR